MRFPVILRLDDATVRIFHSPEELRRNGCEQIDAHLYAAFDADGGRLALVPGRGRHEVMITELDEPENAADEAKAALLRHLKLDGESASVDQTILQLADLVDNVEGRRRGAAPSWLRWLRKLVGS